MPWEPTRRVKFAHTFCRLRNVSDKRCSSAKGTLPVIFGAGVTASLGPCSPPLQPLAKRARVEGAMEAAYRAAVQAATGALEAVGALLQKAPAPGWLPAEMAQLQATIQALRRRVREEGA